MNAQSSRSLSLSALLLLAALPAAAAAGQPGGQRGDFMRQAVQAATASPATGHGVAPASAGTPGGAAGAASEAPLFTLAGVRFSAMGTDPLRDARQAGFHVSLFHLLNAISDQRAPLAAEDYVLRLNVSF